jgi:hypothetical protein
MKMLVRQVRQIQQVKQVSQVREGKREGMGEGEGGERV